MRFLSSRDQMSEAVSTWANVVLCIDTCDTLYNSRSPERFDCSQPLRGYNRERLVIRLIRFDRSTQVAKNGFIDAAYKSAGTRRTTRTISVTNSAIHQRAHIKYECKLPGPAKLCSVNDNHSSDLDESIGIVRIIHTVSYHSLASTGNHLASTSSVSLAIWQDHRHYSHSDKIRRRRWISEHPRPCRRAKPVNESRTRKRPNGRIGGLLTLNAVTLDLRPRRRSAEPGSIAVPRLPQ